MAYRRKNYRAKRRSRKRLVKRMKKRVTYKRRFKRRMQRTRRRKARPVRMNLKAESRRQNYRKFTILVDLGTTNVSSAGDTHIEFRNFNAKDLLDRCPELGAFMYCRVKKATLRWKLKDFDKTAYRFERARTGTYMSAIADINDGANKGYFPDANLQRWINAMSETQPTGFATNFNLDTFSANYKHAKLHSIWSGMRTFRPYVGEVKTNLFTSATNTANNEMSTTAFLAKNFKAWLNLGSQQAASWMNDVRFVMPELSYNEYFDLVYDAAGTTLVQKIKKQVQTSKPFYTFQLSIEVEAHTNNTYFVQGTSGIDYPAPPVIPPAMLRSTRKRPNLPESDDVKEANAKVQKLIDEVGQTFGQDEGTQQIRDHVVNSIANSNPLLAGVASVIGLRSNIARAELKK